MNKKTNTSFEFFSAVRCGTFQNAEDLAAQVTDFSYNQLYEELDCGFSSLESGWSAASHSLQELSEKVRDVMAADDSEDEPSEFELVRLKVNVEIEIIRKGT